MTPMYRQAMSNKKRVTSAVIGWLLLCALARAEPAWHVASSYQVDVAATSTQTTTLDFHAGTDWPNVILQGPQAGSQTNTLLVPLTNRSAETAEVFFRLGDDDEASWPAHAIAASMRLAPGQSTTVLLPFVAEDPRALGMQFGPPPGGSPPQPVTRLDMPKGQLAGARAHTLVITLWGQTGARHLELGELRFAMLDWSAGATQGLIDRYGQSTRTTWPERVNSDLDLTAKALLPQLSLPEGLGLDPYGGVIGAADQAGSGYFKIAQPAPGHYQLVTPEGHAFFSLGVNTVGRGEGATYVAGRETMFSDLPKPGTQKYEGSGDDRSLNLSASHIAFNHGRWLNFYDANLQRRFGPNFADAWRDESLARLRSWGFNTLGNWSDPALRQAPGKMPYAVAIALKGDFAHVVTPLDFWGPLPDPFDARFARGVEQSVEAATRTTQSDRFVLGDFVENELPWGDGADPRSSHRYSVAFAVFALGPTSAAKSALVNQLKSRYDSIDQFNLAWHVQVPSWDALSSHPPALSDALPPAAQDDLKQFSASFAERYYSTVKSAIAKVDPHHLYLGSRLAAITPEALAACVHWCDVVSVNQYSTAFDARLGPIDKPILVSEFGFGAKDRGLYWGGLIDVGSELERARHYSAFVASARNDPRVVGTHWFEYLDEPASGRLLDGENGNFGVVSITDVPFFTLVEAMQATNIDAIRRLNRP